MPEPNILPTTLALLERVAGAIRRELGEAVDAYPGYRSPDGADPLNRAFRAVVRSLVEADGPPVPNLDGTVSGTLRLLAERRLAAERWDDRRPLRLIEGGPGSPDDWLAFLILSSRPQLEPLLDREGE
jgi:hypothetical protein